MQEKIYQDLLLKVEQGAKSVLLTYLKHDAARQGTIEKKQLLTEEELEKRTLELDDIVYQQIDLSLNSGKLKLVEMDRRKSLLIEPFLPEPRLLVFGGGHIAKPLTEFAARVGFAVTVIDDRPFFANAARFPEAKQVICQSFEKCFDELQLRESDYVVIITRGHRYDGVVLREILLHDVAYVGMIGSKRRVSAMREELALEGYDKDRLSRVNAPIGLDIGAITPDEIAISIVSQLISYKNKGIINRFGKDFVFPEFDRAVAEKISEESTMPKALVTILSSKGSVPRKAGAKMVAYYDGSTAGSIGGGCSEAGVIANAKGLMLGKGFSIEHVDMTGDVAEDEGMVCGGVMEVLVEVF